tara:strand:+ start:1501 stop:1779 length:279 start_codon:yes stop_codon:yes gene_type:complete
MLRVGDRVEDKIEYAGGIKYQGVVTEDLGNGFFTVRWDHGSYSAESDHHEFHLARLCTANRFNFIIFKNYDGSVDGKLIPRETYNRLFSESV